MNLKKLVKMLEAETDMEKAAEVLQKIDSLIVRKGVLRMCSNGYLKPLAVESHICKRDAFEKIILIAISMQTQEPWLLPKRCFQSRLNR